MKVLVTGSSGHLGEALVRCYRAAGQPVVGMDLKPSAYTDVVGTITDAALVRDALHQVDVVIHTATLHKPHLVTHSARDFIDSNVSGTQCLLDEAVRAGVRAFIYTSTTSAFGRALNPPLAEPAAWVTEALREQPKNIYGVTKTTAEQLCALTWQRHGLPCVVLRTSRFFPEADDDPAIRQHYTDANAKANEFLHRRVDLQDVVDAHLLAVARAADLGFGLYIVSATSPFGPEDLAQLRTDAPAVVARHVPEFVDLYQRLGWSMFPSIDRVYVNAHARAELGWQPRLDFRAVVRRLLSGEPFHSALALDVGSKGYHDRSFADGPYPV